MSIIFTNKHISVKKYLILFVSLYMIAVFDLSALCFEIADIYVKLQNYKTLPRRLRLII